MSSLIKALRRSNMKHKKLAEYWGDDSSRDVVLEGVTFFVKYIGCSLVEEAKGVRTTARCIKTIIAVAKSKAKKLDRVAITISPTGLRVVDQVSHENSLDVPIYRISYCSADASYDHVFAFISANEESHEIFQCHAFLCPKKKIAHAIALTIAQAFKLAFEAWENSNIQRRLVAKPNEEMELDDEDDDGDDRDRRKIALHSSSHVLLIDLGEDNVSPTSTQLEHFPHWEDFDCDLNFENYQAEDGSKMSPIRAFEVLPMSVELHK